MTRHDRRVRALAFCLTAVAGFVDAIGFIDLGGFFVSFMSGNSTRLAVGLADGSAEAAKAASLIGMFLTGTVGGSLVGGAARARRREVVLAFVALLLALAGCLSALAAPGSAALALAFAMGAENAVFEQDGEIQIGLTYMTGTLVKGGQRIAAALLGGDRWGWVPYLLQWFGLVAGAVAGALVYPLFGLGSIWIAAAAMAAGALVAIRIGPSIRA